MGDVRANDRVDGGECAVAAEHHRPLGWDTPAHRFLDCAVCGQPWPCPGACSSCSGTGEAWDPRVQGNVVACYRCNGTGQEPLAGACGGE